MNNFWRMLFSHKKEELSAKKPDDDGHPEECSAAQRLRKSREDSIVDLLRALVGVDQLDYEKAVDSIFQRTIKDFSSAAGRAIAMDADITVRGTSVGKKSGQSFGSKGSGRTVMSDKVLQHFHNRGFIGWSACAIIAQHEIVNRACSIPAVDAIAHGYKIYCSSLKHKPGADHEADEARWLYDLKLYSDETMHMSDICVQLNYKKKVFGVALAVPRVEGAEYEKPFNIDGIKKGSYKGFSVIDPYWITYEFGDDLQNNPLSDGFYEPEYYRLPSGQRIHKTWIVKCVNTHVPDILKPTYYFGGIPLTQMIYERIFCADKIANEAPLLAMTKRLLIADANVEEMIKDPAHANKMMKAINYFRDNFSIFFKKPSSQVQQIDTSLGEFDQLIMTQYQLVACIAQMPATKLLKVTPTGFQSTGQYEWKDYAQSLLEIQKNDYTPLLNFHYLLALKSLYPDRKDLSVTVEFNPIDVPTKEEAATIESRISQLASTLINSGVVTPEEARSLLRAEQNGLFGFISPVMPDVLKRMFEAKDPANAQPPPGQMPPGQIPENGGAEVPLGPEQGGDADTGGDGEQYSKDFTDAVRKIEEMASSDNEALESRQGGEEGGADAGDAFVKAVRNATGDQSIAFDEAVRIAAHVVARFKNKGKGDGNGDK